MNQQEFPNLNIGEGDCSNSLKYYIMKIHYKDFVQKPNYIYGPWDEKLGCNPVKEQKGFYIPYSSYNGKYALVFNEEEVLNGYIGKLDMKYMFIELWNKGPLFEYKVIKRKWSIKNPKHIIYIIEVINCEADCS